MNERAFGCQVAHEERSQNQARNIKGECDQNASLWWAWFRPPYAWVHTHAHDSNINVTSINHSHTLATFQSPIKTSFYQHPTPNNINNFTCYCHGKILVKIFISRIKLYFVPFTQ